MNLIMKSLVTKFSIMPCIILWTCFLTGCATAVSEDLNISESEKISIKYFLGEYKGDVNIQNEDGKNYRRLDKDLTVSLLMLDGKIVFKSGYDFAGQNCGSRVGKLTRIRFFDKKMLADFEFDAGKCTDHFNADSFGVEIHSSDNSSLKMNTHLRRGTTSRKVYWNLTSVLGIVGHFQK